MVLLDYFNATFQGKPFATHSQAQVLRLESSTLEAVAAALDQQKQSSGSDSLLSEWKAQEREELVPRYPMPGSKGDEKESKSEQEADDEEEEEDDEDVEEDENDETCCCKP